MKTITATIHTDLITSDDGTHTYEVVKRLEGTAGECGFMISLYPTRNEQSIFSNDSTLNHLVSHMSDLGLNEIHIINLFSKVVNGKMSVRGLTVDEENMAYINQIMTDKKFQSGKFIVAWGNSFQTSAAVTESKRMVFEAFQKHCPKQKLYQLTTIGGKVLESDVAPHPLYIGIRSTAPWGLKEFKLPKTTTGKIGKAKD